MNLSDFNIGNDSSGGFRGFFDLAKGMPNIGDMMKELMTNAPHGVTQFTKAPWNFNE